MTSYVTGTNCIVLNVSLQTLVSSATWCPQRLMSSNLKVYEKLKANSKPLCVNNHAHLSNTSHTPQECVLHILHTVYRKSLDVPTLSSTFDRSTMTLTGVILGFVKGNYKKRMKLFYDVVIWCGWLILCKHCTKTFTLCCLVLCLIRWADSGQVSAPTAVYGAQGGSVTVRCYYDSRLRGQEKYWCKELMFFWCTTTKPGYSFIKDNEEAGVFTVTMTSLRESDAGVYRCGVGSPKRFNRFYSVVNLFINPTGRTD